MRFRLSASRFYLAVSVLILCSFGLAKYAFDKNDVIFSVLFGSINQQHYAPLRIDDNFSQKVFDAYINTPFNKQFLLKQDVDQLSKFRNDIDDEINNQRQDFFKTTLDILNKRIAEKENWNREILAKPFDYNVEEEYEVDYKKTVFAATDQDLKNEWRKMLKYFTLYRLDEMLTRQEKAKEKNDTTVKILSFDSLEADARRKTLKSQEDYFRRIKKITPKERFSEFANAVAGIYDPHTQYFAPRDKKRFDQSMSGQFEGIGARLMQKDGILKVSEIMPGSPSQKQGELKPGDEIMKVAQGAAEPVDITNMDMDDAVELIKGKKGTEVRLTVKKSDNTIKVISIIRDVVEIEETYAKSALLESKNRIGYIYLPGFYTDFNRNGAHHCSEDMRKEIEKLKKQKVKGLIIDLRDNGGGSLQEVVDMAGLFFSRGPVVQVKGKNNIPPSILEDKNPEVTWDGPLTILINHNSASASEILAACIQDYKRGVIVGTTSFGKGTVQSFVNLDNQLLPQFDTLKPIGEVKITQQKFYRINGGATQLKGVTPDITLPDPYALIDIGEKQLDNPMPWDEISRVQYTEFSKIDYPTIVRNSQKRVKASPQFAVIEQQAQEVKLKKDDSKYNLKLEKYRAERKEDAERAKKYDELKKDIKGFSAMLLPEDQARLSGDTTRMNRENRWAKNVARDIYIHEAANVLNDMK
jgi:carboxyl-terminal processing protease